MNNIDKSTIFYAIGAITFVIYPIWIHFINPFYLCKIRKYNSEMDKAVKCSKVFWFKVNAGAQTIYEDLLNYSKILEEQLNYLEDYVDKHGLDNIGINQDDNYKELAVEEKINVVYSVFLEHVRSDPYEEYFQKRSIICEWKTDYVEKELKTLIKLTDEDIYSLGLKEYL